MPQQPMMHDTKPLISMVASTLGRDQEMRLLLDTLSAQNDDRFELIVVDQNQDDRLVPILAAYEGRFPIRHVRSLEKGLDRGRNLGARHAAGDWLLFPDDDSWYPPEFLTHCAALSPRSRPTSIPAVRSTGTARKSWSPSSLKTRRFPAATSGTS